MNRAGPPDVRAVTDRLPAVPFSAIFGSEPIGVMARAPCVWFPS